MKYGPVAQESHLKKNFTDDGQTGLKIGITQIFVTAEIV